jgi:arginine repressor
MGRQAKLKKLRQLLANKASQPQQTESTEFVQQLQKQGYTLTQTQHSPDIPEDTTEPQV